jgi:hypothetical protein
VAVDNQAHRAAYVGPIYSYYEFTAKTPLTDKHWRMQVAPGPAPPRPEWIQSFMPSGPMRPARRGL